MPRKIASLTLADYPKEALAQLSPAELFLLLQELGIDIDINIIRDIGEALAVRVKRVADSGAVIDADLRDEINEATTRATASAVKSSIKEAIGDSYLREVLAGDGRPDNQKLYMWVNVGTDNCSSCAKRHRWVHTIGEWKQFGLPRSGVLICCSRESRCLCDLVPYVGDKRKHPVNRFELEIAQARRDEIAEFRGQL